MRLIAHLTLLLQSTPHFTSVNSHLTDLALDLHPLSNPALVLHQLTPNGIAAAQVVGFLHPLIGPLNLSLPATSPPPPTPLPPPVSQPCDDSCTVLDVINRSTRLSKLAKALSTSQLAGILTTKNITIFAPDNAAFESLPEDMYKELLVNTTVLQSILLRHMTRGTLYSSDLPASDTPLITGAGEIVTVGRSETGTTITSHMSTANLISPDLRATNGNVILIDAVL